MLDPDSYFKDPDSSFFLSTDSKVMITSGQPFSSSTRTEIIDVIDAGTTCPELAKFPIEVHSAVGANLQGVPIICGGYSK